MASSAQRRSVRRGVRDELWFLAGVAVIACGLGLGVNRMRAVPLSLTYTSKTDRLRQSVARLAIGPPGPTVPPPAPAAPRPSPTTAPEMIDLARFHDLTQSGATVLDARPGLFFRVGHVPGARSLSREAFETDYTRLRSVLEPHRRDPLVIYCAGEECEDSRMVASALQKLGYEQVVIFAGGWEEWQRAGMPEERP